MNLANIKQSLLYQVNTYPSEPHSMERFFQINSSDKVRPEDDLLTFYLITHAFNEYEYLYGSTRRLTLGEEVLANKLVKTLNSIFGRMFGYLMLISIGETRHRTLGDQDGFIEDAFGSDVMELANSIDGTNRSSARHEFLQSDRGMLRYMNYCNWVFIEGFKHTGSYGGKKWKDISSLCSNVLSGEISPYVMIDLSWAMVHNGGSIFNKNTIYGNIYSFTVLCQMLDMQRGGAIPSLIQNYQKYSDNGLSIPEVLITDYHKDLLSEIISTFDLPDLSDFVPLSVVADAGALDNWVSSLKTGSNIKEAVEDNTFSFNGEVISSGLDTYPIVVRNHD